MFNYHTPVFDRLQDCWQKVSEDHLCALEDSLEADLPDDYRDFLLHFNAGDWVHYVVTRVLHPSRFVDCVLLTSTYGIVSDDRFTSSDILSTLEVFTDRIPSTFLPIMSAGGDPVCMDLGEENYGKVYYWDRTWEGMPDKNIEYLIAENFTEFLLGLTPYTELDNPIEELPAFQAAERGDHEAVQRHLLDKGEIDLRNDRGHTLLMCAARNSWPRVVDILLRIGADPNARDAAGWTPLHHAVWSGSLDSVKLLLTAEADTNYRDADGRNLAQIARGEHHDRIYYHLAGYMPYP